MNRLCSVAPLGLVVAVLLCGCSGKEERIDSHLKKGADFLAHSDVEKALLEVRNVLQMDPKRAQAYYLAGEIEESRDELRKAFGDFSKVLEIKPDFYDAKAGLARLYLKVNELDSAQKLTDEVLAADPSNFEARVSQAALLERKGDLDGALKIANAIKVNDRLPAQASLLIASLHNEKGDAAGAQQVIDSALAAEPNRLELLVAAAQLAEKQKNIPKAVQYYQHAVKIAPTNYSMWLAWAGLDQRAGDLDGSEHVLRDAMAQVPDDSKRALALTEFLYKTKGAEAARKELQQLAQDRPRDYAIQFALVNYYETAGAMPEAQKLLEAVIKSDATGPSGLSARDQLTQLDLEAGREAAASQRIEEVLKISARDNQALVMRGRIELAHGKLDAAIADLRSAAKDRPDSVEVLQLLAQAYQANQQTQLARDSIADAVKLFPRQPDLALLQVRFLAGLGQLSDAIAAADAMIQADPKGSQAYELKEALQERSHDLGGAEETLRTWAAQDPQNPIGKMRLGAFFLKQQKNDQALGQFNEAVALAPNAYDPRNAVGSLLINTHRQADAERFVNDTLSRAPEVATNYLLLGQVKNARNDSAGAEAAYRKAVALDPKLAAGYVALVQVLYRRNDLAGASAVFDMATKANPDNDVIAELHADWLAKTGNVDQAIALYDALLKRNPGNSIAANNLAYVLVEQKGDKASLDRALALSERFQYTNQAGLLDTLGWTHYKLGQVADALPLLQRAQALAPEAALFQLHYGLALYKNGDVASAKEHLRSAAGESKVPLPDEALRIIQQG